MKEYYLISEIAALFKISTDALRHYEKLELITPKRDKNGYRLFSLKDIYKLNIIRELRRLEFSLPEVKRYLNELSVAATTELLKTEEQLLTQQIAQLNQQLVQVKTQKLQLHAKTSIIPDQYQLNDLPKRACVQINERITRDEEMDFVIKKLQQKHEAKIRNFTEQTIGAVLSLADLKQGLTNIYHTVFFVLDDPTSNADFMLPKGTYVSTFYRGSYEQNREKVAGLYQYCEKQNLAILGEPFELYQIDNRQTAVESEFLTEIQLLVKPN